MREVALELLVDATSWRATPTNEISAVRSTIVIEMPSTPTKYSTLNERIHGSVLDELQAVAQLRSKRA